MKGISFQAYVSAFYKQNAHKFEIIREKKWFKIFNGDTIDDRKHSLAYATKKEAKNTIFWSN